MHQVGAVLSIFAVIPGVMMAARDVNRALPHKGEELRRCAGHSRSNLDRIIAVDAVGVTGDGRPGEGIGSLRQWHTGRGDMTRVMGEPGVRHGSFSSTTLMVEPQRISPGKGHASASAGFAQ